jgi:pimeloyl-ACP methyl ester carboxylesterase
MRRMQRDGVSLWHGEHGTGDPGVVFVHGFACDHSQFDAQVAHLAPRHRTLAVDLRGHGRSAAPVQDYTMDVFADDVAWQAREAGLDRAVFVGHSMGGVVTAMVAARHPEQVAGVVMLDSAIVPRPELVDALVGWSDWLAGPDHLERLIEVNDAFFEPTDPPAAKRAVQDGLFAPQHVLVSAADGLARFVRDSVDGEPVARPGAWTFPALHVSASMQMNDVDRFRALCPHVLIGQTIGSGHYHQVVVPAQINAMLDRFLELVTGADGRSGA